MMRAGVRRRGDKGDGLGMKRVAYVDDGESVTEHVADEGVPFVTMT